MPVYRLTASRPTDSPRRSTPSRRGLRCASRGGFNVLELIFVLPIVLILLLALVEYGLIYLNLKHLALASRTGAKIAAEQDPFDIAVIQAEVDRHLLSAGFPQGSLAVVLEHNVGSPMTVTISSDSMIPVSTPSEPLPDDTVVPAGCVRVTVAVEATTLAPDLLAPFGLSFMTWLADESTTFPYEGP